ncbi:unnamed protein product [Adineta steineri]|uniref:Uncharacterized protein n=1 Tax=Adineta steineri TaxID=433720 RepID=A0A815EGA2_9BILA|nr:unnamed protein product [Adineta steineri]
MKLLYCIILFPLLVFNGYVDGQFLLPPINLNEYDAYGSLLAMNEYLSILAQNDQEQFTIITNPFSNRSEKCSLPYNVIGQNQTSLIRFVYSVVIGAKQNESQLFFSYINENWRRDVFLTIIFLEPTSAGCVQAVSQVAINITDLQMQEHALVGIDPYGKRAYAVGIYYIVCYEIETGVKWQLNTKQLYGNENSFQIFFFPKALAITEDQIIFMVGQRFTNSQFSPYLFVLNFLSTNSVTLSSSTELAKFNFGPTAIDITRNSIMSIAVSDDVNWFIIGIPYLNMILILSWKRSDANEAPIILQKHISSHKDILFGKSVALLDNNTFVILAHALPTLPWSTSQVQVYSISDDELNQQPLIIYPNNQQIIPSLNSQPPPHSILTVVSWKSHLGLVFDVGVALLLSSSLPGYYSAQLDDDISNMAVYSSVSCIPGTARNTISIGPCFLCPSNTKNNGTSGIECEPCISNDSSLCLRGSLTEIPMDNVSTYDQAIPYPNSPELVEFDDILLEYLFSLTATPPHCLLISPLFWTCLAIGLGLIIFLVMTILVCFPQLKPHRTLFKKCLQHIDLVGEGEVWFGGLITFAIIVLLVFTCKFIVSFTQLYPIETISSNTEETSTCEPLISNTKFTSGLQLLTIGQHDEEKPIFTMLDEQNIILTVHFVGTSFNCDHLVMQENLNRGKKISLNNFNCSYDNEINILSVSTLLPQHLITMQFDLIGPYFVGGLRICLSDTSRTIDDDDKYTLQELDFCQFFYADNETLSTNPTINIKMTKVVNRTVGYTTDIDTIFSGIWIPTLTINSFADTLLFNEYGEYIRYLSDRVTLIVDMSESEFFMMNTQEPIARHTEIVLHTFLFTIVLLDLFGLFFLVTKLLIVPLLKLIHRRFFTKTERPIENHEKHVRLTRVTPFTDHQL